MTTIPILCYTMLYYTILHMYDDQNTKHSTVATIEYYINIAQDDIYTMMQYTILHYAKLYYTFLYYAILYHTIPYHIILHYTILYTSLS